MKRLPLILAAIAIFVAGWPLAVCATGYLIITHDNFYSTIGPLAISKQKQGYQVTIVRTSQIAANPTAQQITNYIKNVYLESGGTLKYVLLVGDAKDPQGKTYIPTHYAPSAKPASTGPFIATDLYYATMDASDYLPDICVGRLPVSTTSETIIMVNKILNYTPASRKVLLFGFSLELPNYGYPDRTNILEPAGFVVDTLLDAAATTTEIVNRINQGRLLVAYYGHGAGACAGTTAGLGICSHELTALTNTKLPVVLSGGCDNNEFDNATSNILGENFVLRPACAVAFVGNTRTGGYGYKYEFADGFYEELSKSGRLGEMLNAGRQAIYDAAFADGLPVGAGSVHCNDIEKINLLGDPELRLTGYLVVEHLGFLFGIYVPIPGLAELLGRTDNDGDSMADLFQAGLAEAVLDCNYSPHFADAKAGLQDCCNKMWDTTFLDDYIEVMTLYMGISDDARDFAVTWITDEGLYPDVFGGSNPLPEEYSTEAYGIFNGQGDLDGDGVPNIDEYRAACADFGLDPDNFSAWTEEEWDIAYDSQDLSAGVMGALLGSNGLLPEAPLAVSFVLAILVGICGVGGVALALRKP